MRLINVHTLELKEFVAYPPRYAILSHRWTEDEISYKEFSKGKNLECLGYDKIRRFCQFTKAHRVTRFKEHRPYSYEISALREPRADTMLRDCLPQDELATDQLPASELLTDEAPTKEPHMTEPSADDGNRSAIVVDWVWVDTCCIDKRSSAELSEAINSMWRWYQNAAYCVAYLPDVPVLVSERKDILPSLRASDWFTRGWTLQELLASDPVLFATSKWELIGQKRDDDILETIVERTSIDRTYLEYPWKIFEASIAQRFSWASTRLTTREEDIAYCLLGLFRVNMPLLYGEGAVKAFRRLQLELISSSADESIFAWIRETGWDPYVGCLARSPNAFRSSGRIVRITDWGSQYFHRAIQYIHRAPFSVTNQGILFESQMIPLELSLSKTKTLAVRGKGYLETTLKDMQGRQAFLLPLNCEEGKKPVQARRYMIALGKDFFGESGAYCRMTGRIVEGGFIQSYCGVEIWWTTGKAEKKKTQILLRI